MFDNGSLLRRRKRFKTAAKNAAAKKQSDNSASSSSSSSSTSSTGVNQNANATTYEDDNNEMIEDDEEDEDELIQDAGDSCNEDEENFDDCEDGSIKKEYGDDGSLEDGSEDLEANKKRNLSQNIQQTCQGVLKITSIYFHKITLVIRCFRSAKCC